MIIPKILVNKILDILAKKFKLKGIMNYVYDNNELDEKTENLENRIKILESMAHPQREFVVCKECKQKIKENKGEK